jgi:ATP-dependent exoDNAse (exonuclease V) alpha subunit
MGYEGKNLLARDAKGLPYDVNVQHASKFSVFEPQKLLVTKGDKIKITANGKAKDGKHLFNGNTYGIHGFDKEGNIKLSNGSTISKDFGHFNLGYVLTSHSSQGKTTDKVIISQSSATFRASSMEQFYVSVSRGKQAVAIYTDDKQQLKQAVSQTVQRTSATELVDKNERVKSAVNEQNRLSVLKKMREKTVETYKNVKAKIRNNELQRTVRTK